MDVNDIFIRVQRTFGDEAGVQVTQDDVIRWINDAQREAVMQNEGLLEKVAFIDSIANEVRYPVPTDLFTLKAVGYRGTMDTSFYRLKYLPYNEFNINLDGWDSLDNANAINSGRPTYYSKEDDFYAIVYPPPEASMSDAIKLTYSRYATDVNSSSSFIDLPPYLHSFVLNFCLMQSYEMDEDWESAGHKEQQIQGDLNFNSGRSSWFGHETYPGVTYIED